MTAPMIQAVDPKTIRRPTQVRRAFSEEAHQEMQASIRSVGILQPVLLRREDSNLVMLDGDRRIRAAIALALPSIQAIVVEGSLDQAMIIQRQLITNCVREDLSALDQARAIRQLMTDRNATAAEVARQIGKSPAMISKLLAILDAPLEVHDRIVAGDLGIKQAYEMVRKTPGSNGPRLHRMQKLTAVLDSKRSIVFHGIDSTMEDASAALEELLGRAKVAMKQGIELPTFLSMLRDQVKV